MTDTACQRMFLDDLNIRYELDAPLGPRTWYGLGGRAQVLAHPADADQLSALAARCHETGTPTYMLGSGANLLVADDGVSGVVICLDAPGFRGIQIDDHRVTVGAGFDLAKLVLATAKAGMAGLACLAGIPATVGGAIRMNAGGRFGDIGESIVHVTVCDDQGQRHERDRQAITFGYRRTSLCEAFILQAQFELTPDDPDRLVARVKEIFRFKKQTQPLRDHSAGCAFKNPQSGSSTCDMEPQPVSAGQWIDRAGLKGHRVGGAEVSPRHANFIVTYPGCTASDVLSLIGHVQQAVADRFGVQLEREVVIWP